MTEQMTNGAASHGDTMPPPPGLEDMLTETKLAKELGISRRTINRLLLRDKIQRWRAKDGTWRYDLEEVQEVLAQAEDSDENAGATKVVLNSSSDVLSQALRLLTQAHTQIGKQQEPMLLALELLAKENARMSSELAALHTTHLDLVKAREAALSEEQARTIAAETMRAQEARKDAIFQALAKAGPTLLAQVGNGSVNAAERKLLASFKREQLELLLATDLLSTEQKANLLIVLESMPREAEPEASEPEAAA